MSQDSMNTAPEQPDDTPERPPDQAPRFDAGEIDPEINRVPPELDPAQGAQPAVIDIPIRNPAKTEFFRVHPSDDFHYTTVLLEVPSGFERVTYLVAPALRDLFPELMVVKTLYLCSTREGTNFLWPIRVLYPGDKPERYARTGHECAKYAKTAWIRIYANPAVGWVAYRSRGDLGEPQWLPLDLRAVINSAFMGRYITDPDHPELRKLRGEN